MSPPFLLTSSEVDFLTLITQKRSLRPREAEQRAWGAQGTREPPWCSHWGSQGGRRVGGGGVCQAERMDGGGVGRHCQTEMKVASKKRKEGRKAETKTSDKENESVQRKWPGGVVPPEESPTAWCFLSSQRLRVGGQLANGAVTATPWVRGCQAALERKAFSCQPRDGAVTPSPEPQAGAGLTTSCWPLLGH